MRRVVRSIERVGVVRVLAGALSGAIVTFGVLGAWDASAQPQVAEPKAKPVQGQSRPAAPGDNPPRGPADIFNQSQRRTTPAPRAPGEPAPADTAGDVPPEAAEPGNSNPSSRSPGATGEAAAPAGPAGAQPGALPTGHPTVSPEGAPAAQPGTAADGPGAAGPGGRQAADEAGEGQAPVGGDPHAGAPDAPALARRPIAVAEPSATVPPGTVHVRVIDAATEQPVSNATLQLGTMSRDNTRTTLDAKAGANGEHRFDKLATGDGQAYRVNVLHDGAKYSSTPFRLPVDHGYEVTIRQVGTTRDGHELVLYVGATSIEVRDERLKVVQQARLINIGTKTYVFPTDGQLVKLPAGATAFQTEDVMTDQHLREEAGQGFKIAGSVAPGEITLTWGFDLPYDTTTVDLTFDLPWVTFAYRVLADAAPGMTLAVDDMPAPELHDDNGRRFWVSEVVKRVGDPPLRTLKIHVKGIPGPGPTRIIALVVALFVLGGGVWFAWRPAPAATAKTDTESYERRKAELLATAKQLEADHAKGEIGPEYLAEQIAQIEEQLAAVLYEQSQISARKPSKAA